MSGDNVSVLVRLFLENGLIKTLHISIELNMSHIDVHERK